ncbi:helix-turn-helix domain-containing protein [Tautonia sociabilis]|uniref:helix-turn-helix domain-containing protein n=1 Tax=Tautonia sociabilis TaxID=2080755 RepID=UPI001F251DE0|nr:helix-turn-helix domain-containing protein [Tautonia sociabilis]
MDWFFFRVEHDLLRSEAFRSLGGSAIKVYLVIGLFADFGTGWAYPSIRTIAKQSGLSRQTVLDAIAELTRAGLLATSKSPGKATAYKILRNGPDRPARKSGKVPAIARRAVPEPLENPLSGGPFPFEGGPEGVPDFSGVAARPFGRGGRGDGPERDPATRDPDDNTSIPIPGTPFRITAEGKLLVAVDLQELLTEQGLPKKLARKLASQKEPEDVAKVLLNALFLQSQGKLQNGPGYIRAGIEDGYELLPQVATKLEVRRRQLEEHLRSVAARKDRDRVEDQREAEEEAIRLLIERLHPEELQRLVDRAVEQLPGPIVRRNPTLSNPFVRGKVYELAGGEPIG